MTLELFMSALIVTWIFYLFSRILRQKLLLKKAVHTFLKQEKLSS